MRGGQDITRLAAAAAGALWLALAAPVQAAGLQVEPVLVTIRERSAAIWLENTSAEPLNAQVRAYDWSQDTGQDQLAPTTQLQVSPPMLRIPPGGRQLVRLVVNGVAESCEDSFRLAIDELPTRQRSGSGLRYVMHYSVPVFVAPKRCGDIAPALTWRLEREGAATFLAVDNPGTQHAQLARVTLEPPGGKRIELTAGLLGYVLPGARMRFALPGEDAALARGGKLEVMVNGTSTAQSLAPAALAAR